MAISLPIHGRGAASNPTNRFVPIRFDVDGDYLDSVPADERPDPRTRIFFDDSRTIIAHNESPDIPFTHSINPYRGCEHGCSYCFARPFHEYLGLSAGIDFETQLFAKTDAAKLLRVELSKPKWVPQPIMMSGVTDPYQPIERKLRITRSILEVMLEFRNPVAMISKNALVARDADLLGELAKLNGAVATLSITSLDPKTAAAMEPRASSPRSRLDAVSKLAAAGVPVGVSVSPIVPGLTDHETASILKAAREAGARHAFFVPLRLPGAVKPIFLEWLQNRFPDRYDKVVNRQFDLRGEKMNDARWFKRFTAEGPYYAQMTSMFSLWKTKLGYEPYPTLTAEHFRVPREQLDLF